jgi:hypothetical protein
MMKRYGVIKAPLVQLISMQINTINQYELNIPELNYLSHCCASLAVELSVEVKSGFEGLIQVDIGGHPHFPNGSKQFSGHFGNLLFLAGFHFRGHFEGLNEVFSRSRFSMIAEGMIEPPK